MALGGEEWNGWFPMNGELTSGKPDRKEGIYCGQTPNESLLKTSGLNLLPQTPVELTPCIHEWMAALSKLGKTLLSGIALALGMPEEWFATTIAKVPTEQFAIFHYPPPPTLAPGEHPGWGVGVHTDFGLITILAQDDCGGL